jgi:hypothetical protein
MQCFRGRTTAGVKVEFFTLFIGVEDFVEVTVGEEDATAEEDVGRATGEAVDTVNKCLVESLTAEFVDKFVIINLAAVFGGDFPWVDYLVLFFC